MSADRTPKSGDIYPSERHRRMGITAEDVAYARLLRAAPDLLMALRMALPALEWCEKQWASSPQHGDGIDVMAVVRAAIAKAEGEAP